MTPSTSGAFSFAMSTVAIPQSSSETAVPGANDSLMACTLTEPRCDRPPRPPMSHGWRLTSTTHGSPFFVRGDDIFLRYRKFRHGCVASKLPGFLRCKTVVGIAYHLRRSIQWLPLSDNSWLWPNHAITLSGVVIHFPFSTQPSDPDLPFV